MGDMYSLYTASVAGIDGMCSYVLLECQDCHRNLTSRVSEKQKEKVNSFFILSFVCHMWRSPILTQRLTNHNCFLIQEQSKAVF